MKEPNVKWHNFIPPSEIDQEVISRLKNELIIAKQQIEVLEAELRDAKATITLLEHKP